MTTNTYKRYLGDAVYVDFDGYAVVLTTENGVSVQNTIVLEPDTLDGLLKYIKSFTEVAGAKGHDR